MKFARRLVAACIASLAVCVLSPALAQQNYPTKPITLVYPYAAGSAPYLFARQVAEILTQALGQPVIVDARPGAGGSTALEQVVRTPADGYTLVLAASGTMAVNPHTYKLNYKPVDDLVSISTLVEIPFIVVTRNSLAPNNLEEFIAYAKANPGNVAFANTGMGTQAHLTQGMFLAAAGISANVISYRGGSQAMTDLLGGHIDALIDNAAGQVQNVRTSQVKAMFVTTQERTKSLNSVPTANEAGLPGFVTSGWYSLAAPKGTPPAIVDQLNKVIVAAFAKPEVRAKLADGGWVPVANSPAQAEARARADLDRLGVIARKLNLQPN